MKLATLAVLAALLAAPLPAQPAAGSDPAALVQLGRSLIAQRRPDEALAVLDQAAERGAPRAAVATQRGIALDLKGELAAAQQAYTIALAADPADPETVQRMALSLALGGKSGAAQLLVQRLGAEGGSARRTLALVHALGGRQADAAEIAMASMSIAEARRMRTFYAQLPRLPLRDRAAAVHLGALPGGAAPAMPPAVPTTTPVQPADQPSQVIVTPVGSPDFVAAPGARAALSSDLLSARPRIWVQLSSVADAAALSGEWQRIRRSAGEALDGQLGYMQRTGTTNRLLIGPFASEAAARAMTGKLKAKQVDAILNRTPAGANLAPLGR